MSTYIVVLSWWARSRRAKPVDAGGIPLRVVTPPGEQQLTGSLEVAAHALALFTEYFGQPYPGAKLDLVDVPDFALGAMENLGCVTFRETALLVMNRPPRSWSCRGSPR